jgi:hypothetical protein
MGINPLNPVKIESPVKVERGLPNTKAVKEEKKPQPKPVKKAIVKTIPKKIDQPTAQKKEALDKSKLKISDKEVEKILEMIKELDLKDYPNNVFNSEMYFESVTTYKESVEKEEPTIAPAEQKDLDKLDGELDGLKFDEKKGSKGKPLNYEEFQKQQKRWLRDIIRNLSV